MSDWQRFSRLPESPEYWRDASERLQHSARAAAALPPLPVQSLAPFAWMAVAATIAAVMVSRATPAESRAAPVPRGLLPSDPAAVTWLSRSGPPSVAEMLFAGMKGADSR